MEVRVLQPVPFNKTGGAWSIAKSKYESHVLPKLDLVEKWARDGLGTKQIAKNLGIAESTFWDYSTRYPEFSSRLAKGREVVDTEVENAFLKRITGYDTDDDSWAELKQEFVDKGWTVTFQYGGTITNIALSEDEQFRGVPVYARLIEVSDEDGYSFHSLYPGGRQPINAFTRLKFQHRKVSFGGRSTVLRVFRIR